MYYRDGLDRAWLISLCSKNDAGASPEGMVAKDLFGLTYAAATRQKKKDGQHKVIPYIRTKKATDPNHATAQARAHTDNVNGWR
jgi:hypothetical protein